MFSKILIANRGEIAVRIIRACREMGISTVAVFSEADRDALHVNLADESLCIGGPFAADSYLNMLSILSAAVSTGAQAIHPGYGFLAENARFAELCEQVHIAFIGPSPTVIARMGEKDTAKTHMQQAGIPVVPGCDCVGELDEVKQAAAQVGYPLLIKARAGGGGRGIRLVREASAFEAAYLSAASEAASAFGDGGLYLEKYLSPVKHIEVQLLCDQQGNVVCLGERECSVQRKNQKLLEESPAPTLSAAKREELFALAERAARAISYTNAGTLEFLMDADQNLYFCEMNTRLQVEHPVTEMVTGIDLVKWQIRVAAGQPLSFSTGDISPSGCAIECRINAEDPDQNFRPSCGKISLLHVPGGPWVRFDSAIYQEYEVPPYYDSLIGKLVVYAKTRGEAIRKMQAALCELVIEGISHNADLHKRVLSNRDFISGRYGTQFLAELFGQAEPVQVGG
ncbi:MAG: acetyl-CoA carboxylase biotin carboxylase subunit [Clostridiales bacterium]|nr:acetyl-CoA carboxylase biotin carboxylase subunit [Clostridiales bacterium]